MASKDSRDDLDRRLARAVRAARRPHGLPAPGGAGDDDILRVAEGCASGEQRARVEGDAEALAKVEVLRSALAETGHTGGPLTRAARYVFVFARDTLTLLRAATEPVGQPAAAALRGSARAFDAYYEFVQPLGDDGHEALLKIEHVTRGMDRDPSIDVAVTLPGLSGARVSLWRAGESVDSVPVDAAGSAMFAGLGRDRYELVFSRAGADLGRVSLDFIAG